MLISALFGFVIFAYLYGIEILHPHYFSWLLSGDSSIYFFGFNFFNQEPWHLPLGQINSYSFPEGASVVYTDSSPLVSIGLKALNFLPGMQSIYQFHGIWILTCFALQGALGFFLFYRYTRNWWNSLIGSVFLVTLPSFLNRGYEGTRHYSLLPHFILLLALALAFHPKKKRSVFTWAALTIIALGLHFYLAFVVGFFAFASLYDRLKEKRFQVFICTVAVVIASYFYGYFTIPLGNSSAGGFGLYSMNLNALFNPNPYPAWLPIWPTANPLQSEGFQYMGLGFLILSLMYLRPETFRKLTLPNQCAIIFLILLSLSFRLSFGPWVIGEWFTVPAYFVFVFYYIKDFEPSKAKRAAYAVATLLLLFAFGKIARATGRFFWPIEYLALFLILMRKPHPSILAMLLLVQLGDLSGIMKAIHTQNIRLNTLSNPARPIPEAWNEKDFDHISFVRPGSVHVTPLVFFALEKHKTIGPLILARASSRFRKFEQDSLSMELAAHQFRPHTLYVIEDQNLWDNLKAFCAAPTGPCQSVQLAQTDLYRLLLSR